MAMNFCEKCLENNWKYAFIDGWIIATCVICGNVVEFPSRKTKRLENWTGKKS